MISLQTYSYNLEVAKIFGVCTSVFLSCIENEFLYQERNKQLNENKTISLSRAEIYARTALDDDKQIDVELALKECGVLSVKPLQNIPNKNYYIINYEQLNNILTANNPADVIGEAKASQFTFKKRVEPVSKRQTHISNLKKKINVKDPVLQNYFIDWVDAVYTNPKGFLSPKAVEIAQNELLTYTGDNQEKQISIMKIAIKGGLRDLSWAIEQYEKDSGTNSINFANYNDIKSNGKSISNTEVF